MTSNTNQPNTTELAAEIVAAFVSRNSLPVSELPALILSVDATLRRLATGAPATVASPAEQPTPAVSIRKSVTADHLICLDDGKRFKSLKRHLATLGMTPEEYRAKWGLPADYPMVAANYAARRSDLAKSIGTRSIARQGGPGKARAQAEGERLNWRSGWRSETHPPNAPDRPYPPRTATKPLLPCSGIQRMGFCTTRRESSLLATLIARAGSLRCKSSLIWTRRKSAQRNSAKGA